MNKNKLNEIVGCLIIEGRFDLARSIKTEGKFDVKVTLKKIKRSYYIVVSVFGTPYSYIAPNGFKGGTQSLFKSFKIRIGKVGAGKAFAWLKRTAVPLGKNFAKGV